jgi:xylan 1,4-beta-xylosidase
MDDFLQHVTQGENSATGTRGTPTDFVSFHAKGNATFINGHVRLNLGAHLKTIDEGFAKIASIAAVKDKPVIIGESDPEACAACQGPQLAYRNSTMYSSYTAASFVRKLDLADRYNINLEGALTWAFEFEDQRYFAGFRALATNGIDLPVLNVFRMFNRMHGERLRVTSDAAIALNDIISNSVRNQPDISALASFDGHTLYVMAWHYHDDDVPGPDANIELDVSHVPAPCAMVTQYRIDQHHSNAFAAWQRLGSPNVLNETEYAEVEAAGKLSQFDAPTNISATRRELKLKLTLPRQGVSLFEFDLSNSQCRH